MDRVQLFYSYIDPLQGDGLLSTTKSPGSLGTYLFDLKRMTA